MPGPDSRLDRLATDAANLMTADPDLSRAAGADRPLAVAAREPGFAALVDLILGQQVSIDAAAAMMRSLTDALDGDLAPSPFLLLDDATLRRCGFSRQKAGYARAIAAKIESGMFDPSSLDVLGDEEAGAVLMTLHGVGPWTAEAYLLFVLMRRDIFPAGDLALQAAWQDLRAQATRPDEPEMRAIAERWRPRRSAAAAVLWRHYLAIQGRTAPG